MEKEITVAQAINHLANMVKHLGNGTATGDVGATEMLAMQVRDGSKTIADAIFDLAQAIREHTDSQEIMNTVAVSAADAMRSPSQLRAKANEACLKFIMERLKFAWRPDKAVTIDVTQPNITNHGIDAYEIVNDLKEYGWSATWRMVEDYWQFTVKAE